MSEEAKEVTMIKLGDEEFDTDVITPSHYFDYVKGLKQNLNKEEYNVIIDTALQMLKKTKITNQTDMAAKITSQVELYMRELDVASKGFDIFVERKEIEKYIDAVEGRSVKVIELSRYSREIPDEVIDKIAEAKELFDEIYIIFTDYTLAESKKVAKERRDKDPIAFGAFKNKDNSSSSPYVEDRFFFIADWVDELCDLTLEEVIRDVRSREGREITYKVSTPSDAEEVKKILKSYEKPAEEVLEPVTLFEKVKETAKKTTKKVKEAVTEAPKKKRGRPRKKKDDVE